MLFTFWQLILRTLYFPLGKSSQLFGVRKMLFSSKITREPENYLDSIMGLQINFKPIDTYV